MCVLDKQVGCYSPGKTISLFSSFFSCLYFCVDLRPCGFSTVRSSVSTVVNLIRLVRQSGWWDCVSVAFDITRKQRLHSKLPDCLAHWRLYLYFAYGYDVGNFFSVYIDRSCFIFVYSLAISLTRVLILLFNFLFSSLLSSLCIVDINPLSV